MNKERRRELQRAYDMLDNAKQIIEDIADAEQDAFDNLPEGLQASDRGARLEENSYNLDEAADAVISAIELVEGAME